MGIPENIDALLVKYDITQDHLARIAGVTSGAISGWRKGSTPRRRNVQAICDYFGLSEDDILSSSAGLAAKEHGRFPSNRIPVKGVPMGRVPLVGNTHAGKACLPEELDEFPEVDGDCLDRVCPPGMVAVVQPGVAAHSGDVVVATIDGSDSIMRRMTVINGDLILSPESHNADHENMYIAAQDDRQVHVEHVAYFQIKEGE